MSKTQHSISSRGLDLVKSFESFQANWYTCPAGKPTIGYGHVKRQGDGVVAPLSHDQALVLLRDDMATFEKDINLFVKVPLTQNQFDALCSFVFNVGFTNFRGSTLLEKLNAGDVAAAAQNFPRWIYANKQPLEGLKRRRAAERALFEEAA